MPDQSGTPGSLDLQPLVHVQDLAAALDFYTTLGARLLHGSRDGDFALLQIGAAQLALLAHPPNPEQHEGQVELNFVTQQPLEALEQHLRTAGVTIARPAGDESFGRQLQIRTPDGLLVKINTLAPQRYT